MDFVFLPVAFDMFDFLMIFSFHVAECQGSGWRHALQLPFSSWQDPSFPFFMYCSIFKAPRNWLTLDVTQTIADPKISQGPWR